MPPQSPSPGSDFFFLIFWLTLTALFYTYFGYPLLMLVLARISDPLPEASPPTEAPTITIVLAAHNEATRVKHRLKNLLATDYPPGKITILAVADGCTDDTVAEIRSFADSRISLINEPHRAGKAHALNRALAAARSEIIVFADVRQRFAPDTIPQLVKPFHHLCIGAVSGELHIETAASATGGGVDAYWRLEKIIRRAEARWDSSIGCTGAVYAIRRTLYRPLPADTILDDVVIPMQIAQQGYRVTFEPAARAYDPQTLEPGREQIRKRRTLAGNYQMLFRHPGWLLPWRHRLWWQLISHKYLRLGAPFALLLLFAINLTLAAHHQYWIPLLGQIIFYSLAACGMTHPLNKKRWLTLPAGFVFLNWMAAQALWHFLRPPRSIGWQKPA